ncbi:MAG TPA: alpha/beta hydrolase [Firmicutes bacterium]|jgi:pimeloyl-ACP methyl ester carboxylesterase|nr:alpha/beta hydrolase [Bacillota bacterium]
MLNKKMTNKDFPIGFYNDLHPDFSINFQMNRFYNWTNDPGMLNEMRKVSPSIHTYTEYIDTFLALSKKALSEGQPLRAAYYLRGAEFYIPSHNPQKETARKQFIALMQGYFNISQDQHHKVPYETSFLSAYRFTPEHPKGTIVLFGGFDSYVEELFLMAIVFKDAGYDVVCFDGPGQGITLEDNKIPMTPEWEKPVKAVLDFFNLNNVTLIGMSLGGYLVIRAAAFESRIERVIADDVCANFYEIVSRQIPDNFREQFHSLMINEKIPEVNAIFEKLMGKSLMLEWAINQGMHITGSQTPYEFLRKMISYNTTEISSLVLQDVLLMAAQEDHYIPLNQFFEQSQTLTNVRSLTTRLFTRKEQAHNHCHMGNIGLSIDVMLNWIQQVENKQS